MTSEIGFFTLHYMPCISLFRSMSRYNAINFQIHLPYRKMSFRNRCIIAGSQGMQTLSIPLKGGRGVRDPYHNVMIDHHQPWHLHHWRAIYSAYGRSPWFEYYATSLEQLFSSPPERLEEWNLRCLQWLFSTLGLSFPGVHVDSANELQADDYRSVAEQEHPTPQCFQSGHHGTFPSYIQVFQEKNGFLPNLSMLDFVLCAGPRTVRNWILQPIPPDVLA